MDKKGINKTPNLQGFPGCSDGKEDACNAGGLGSIPGSSLQEDPWKTKWQPTPVLVNPMDRGACRATVHGVKKSRTQLSDFLQIHTHTHTHTYLQTTELIHLKSQGINNKDS